MLSLANDRMPTKSELTNLGRIAHLINDLNSVNPLFYFSYYIKQLQHLGCYSIFGKRKNTRAAGECIFTLSENRVTSRVHGSRNPARKTIQ